MTAIDKWTPLGCSAPTGLPHHGEKKSPPFPEDLLVSLKKLDLGMEDLYLAWEISNLGKDDLSLEEFRALIMLILSLRLVVAEGSTRLSTDPAGGLKRLLADLGANSAEQAAVKDLLLKAVDCSTRGEVSGLGLIVGAAGSYRPLILEHDCLYMQKLHFMEDRVSTLLKRLLEGENSSLISRGIAAGPEATLDQAFKEIFTLPSSGSSGKIKADQSQKKAVQTALKGRITLISGKPGSGKTTIIAGLLRILIRQGFPMEAIALAAPTGKAADRMQRSVREQLTALVNATAADKKLAENIPPASTLHRLLGYSPKVKKFRHNEYNPLAEKFIIVDESSMIDLAMMDNLLRALQPEASIVFLGDAEQLPSIEAGTVFKAICQSPIAVKKRRVAVLERSYRTREDDKGGRQILRIAESIQAGINPVSSDNDPLLTVRSDHSGITFEGVEMLETAGNEQRQAFYRQWLDRLTSTLPDFESYISRVYHSGPTGFSEETSLALNRIISHYERFRILCVTRVMAGGTGTEAVNAWFGQLWSKQLAKAGVDTKDRSLNCGEPVIVTKNDYNLNLYNGDSGLLLRVAPSGRPGSQFAETMAVFPRGSAYTAYPVDALHGRLEPAWATTVHKAQGSEFASVALVLPETELRPLSRELLYTAVTRARESVVIVGFPDILTFGIGHKVKRNSGLADRLK